jgi:hypothetical protein
MKSTLKFCFVSIVLLSIHQHAFSQKIDLEADPIAYALNGFSIHAGLNTDHVRYNFGIFGIEIPESFHGNEGFNSFMWGTGIKTDYFFRSTESGFYTGAGLDLTSLRISLEDTDSETTVAQVSAAINIGYKIKVTQHLFVKPWFGLSYLFNANDVEIDGQIFEQSSIRPFPTVHVGWSF